MNHLVQGWQKRNICSTKYHQFVDLKFQPTINFKVKTFVVEAVIADVGIKALIVTSYS